MSPGHVQGLERHGQLHGLLRRHVFSDFCVRKQRNVCDVCRWTICTRGQRKLHCVPRELCRAGAEWIHYKLPLQFRFHRPERRPVCAVSDWYVQSLDRQRVVHGMCVREQLDDRTVCVLLSRAILWKWRGVCTSRCDIFDGQ